MAVIMKLHTYSLPLLGFSQDCSGVSIGDLPTYFENVRGELYVEDEYTFCIRNFSYDGGGPGKLLKII